MNVSVFNLCVSCRLPMCVPHTLLLAQLAVPMEEAMVHVFPHWWYSRDVGVCVTQPALHITRNVSHSQCPCSLEERKAQ